MARGILYLVLCLYISDLTYGICLYTSLKREQNAYGPGRRYCQYFPNGDKSIALDIMIGSRFETRDCMRCECSDQGFRCCGIGIRARKIHVPPHCQLLSKGCTPMLVLKSDIYADCYNGRPVNQFYNGGFRQNGQRDMMRQMKMLQRQFNGKEGENELGKSVNTYLQGNPFMAMIQSLLSTK